MEAIFLGCVPVLPNRLTYPGIVLGNSEYLYEDPSAIPGMIASALVEKSNPKMDLIRGAIRGFSLERIVRRWDEIIEELSG